MREIRIITSFLIFLITNQVITQQIYASEEDILDFSPKKSFFVKERRNKNQLYSELRESKGSDFSYTEDDLTEEEVLFEESSSGEFSGERPIPHFDEVERLIRDLCSSSVIINPNNNTPAQHAFSSEEIEALLSYEDSDTLVPTNQAKTHGIRRERIDERRKMIEEKRNNPLLIPPIQATPKPVKEKKLKPKKKSLGKILESRKGKLKDKITKRRKLRHPKSKKSY